MANPVATTTAGPAFRFRMEFAEPAAVPDDVAGLSEALAAFLDERGVGGEDAYAVQLALEELLTNLGKFGVPAAGAGAVARADGEVAVAGAEVVLTLADNAEPFDPTGRPPPDLDPEALLDRPVGGLGLHLLFQLFQDVVYRRENGRNVTAWRRRRSG